MPRERQVSFHAGELDPELWGRYDLGLYNAGARTLRNMLVTARGAATTRPGTQHVATLGDPEQLRLWPFVYAVDDAFVMAIEGGNQPRMTTAAADEDDPRFSFRSLVRAHIGNSHINPLGRIAQIGNIVTFTTPGVPNGSPVEIRRITADAFDAGAWESRSGQVMWVPPGFPTLPDWDTGEPLGSLGASSHYDSSDSGDEIAHNYPHVVLEDGDTSANFITPTDAGTPALIWEWQCTLVMRSAKTGLEYETLPYDVTKYINLGVDAEWATGPHTLPKRVVVDASMPVVVAVGAEAGTIGEGAPALGFGVVVNAGDIVVKARLYRGREGRFGFIDETEGYFLTDRGADPVWTDPPPNENHPFRVFLEDGTDYTLDYPLAVAYFEGRRYFARTTERTAHVFGSAVENFYDFIVFTPADDADPVLLVLAGEINEAVQHLVGTDRGLLVLTEADEHLLSGSGTNDPISPNGLWSRSLGTRIGSSDVAPVKVGQMVYMVERDGADVWGLHFSNDGVAPIDVGLQSRHLFAGHQIVAMAYQRRPNSILWLARDDGVLLSCTVIQGPNGLIHALARHEVTDGLVEDVRTIPEATEDGVYLVVNHDGTRYLERLGYTTLPLTPDASGPDARYAVNLDRAVTYNGRNDDDEVTITDYLDNGADIGDTVRVTFGSGNTGLEGSVLQIDNPAGGVPVRVQLGTESPARTYDAEVIAAPVDTTSELETQPAQIPAALLATALTGWWLCAQTVGGLGHLEGQTVTALADGAVVEDLVVSAGAVNLGEVVAGLGGAAIATVGLPYTCDFESLASAFKPTETKTVRDAWVEMMHARGGHVGQTIDGKLYELKTRTVADAYGPLPLRRVKERVPVAGSWDTDAYVAFQQQAPLPATLLGITRDIVPGGSNT